VPVLTDLSPGLLIDISFSQHQVGYGPAAA